MSYLRQYDRISPDLTQDRLALINQWIRSDWRVFFAELRECRPIFHAPGLTLITRFSDVVEVLSRHDSFQFGHIQYPWMPRLDRSCWLAMRRH